MTFYSGMSTVSNKVAKFKITLTFLSKRQLHIHVEMLILAYSAVHTEHANTDGAMVGSSFQTKCTSKYSLHT